MIKKLLSADTITKSHRTFNSGLGSLEFLVFLIGVD
jgi:hypothetical protein